MTALTRGLVTVASRLMGDSKTCRLAELLLTASGCSGTKIIALAHERMGIQKHADHHISGERYVLQSVLPRYLGTVAEVTVFDVGANIGNYALETRRWLPKARIYAFEPNPFAYERLVEQTSGRDIVCLDVGLGEVQANAILHAYQADPSTQLGTLYAGAFAELHRFQGRLIETADQLSVHVRIEVLDQLCNDRGVSRIDFLKLDVEGHELSVLRGARGLLSARRIGLIQFEFNELNVLSRVFLKDFYDLLPGYSLYRMDTDRLHPLGDYSPINEIFRYQNILAIPSAYPQP